MNDQEGESSFVEQSQTQQPASLVPSEKELAFQKKKKAILQERARKLAEAVESEKKNTDSLEVVEFSLGNESYCIESQFIREVYPIKEFTRLPSVPSFVFGLINVRRRILSVIDLKQLFEISNDKGCEKYKVIILENAAMEFGILADEIKGVTALALEKIQPSIATLTGVRQDFLKGITAEGLIVLDGEKLLVSEKLVVKEKRE